MSRPSSDILPSLNSRKKKNILWIYTYYLDLKPHTLTNMDYTTIWKSEKFSPKYFKFSLQFQFRRINKDQFRFACIRTLLSTSPGDYTLQFYCSINILDHDPNVLVLPSNKNIIFQTYELNPSFLFSPTASKSVLELKVLVKMIEYDCASNLANIQQEQNFRKLKEVYFNNEPVLNDLRYILHISKVQDIFTGHQDDKFAALKSIYIARTATYSRQIAKYMRDKDAHSTVTPTNLGPILNYILNNEEVLISDRDLFNVYYEAHRMGLNFLVDLSRDVILRRLGIQNFMLEALQAAEYVDDIILFEKIVETFNSLEIELLNLETVKQLKRFRIQSRFMVRSLERRLRKKESESRVEIGESSKSFTTIDLTSE